MKLKLPWYVKHEPRITSVANAELAIDDHLGHEVLSVTEWPNGEGFDIFITPDKGPETNTALTWQQWGALKIALRALKAAAKS